MDFKVGEWYEFGGGGETHRLRCIAVDVPEIGGPAFTCCDGCLWDKVGVDRHLTGCTGWDWKPVEYPLWWRSGYTENCVIQQHDDYRVTYYEVMNGKFTEHDRVVRTEPYDAAYHGNKPITADEAKAWIAKHREPKWKPPEPGDGWRLLAAGETPQLGDEFYSWWSGAWIQWAKHTSKGPISEQNLVDPATGRSFWVRRRVEPVKQSVPTGWTQVGGIAGGMLWFALDDSDSAAEVAPISAQVENTAESELWRELEVGETIREGDETADLSFGHYMSCWIAFHKKDAGRRVDRKLFPNHVYRRRVRVESPGWRYLDEGETVVAGDECQSDHSCRWGKCCTTVGDRVLASSVRLFRRKISPG
jgi:hypothetical protein